MIPQNREMTFSVEIGAYAPLPEECDEAEISRDPVSFEASVLSKWERTAARILGTLASAYPISAPEISAPGKYDVGVGHRQLLDAFESEIEKKLPKSVFGIPSDEISIGKTASMDDLTHFNIVYDVVFEATPSVRTPADYAAVMELCDFEQRAEPSTSVFLSVGGFPDPDIDGIIRFEDKTGSGVYKWTPDVLYTYDTGARFAWDLLFTFRAFGGSDPEPLRRYASQLSRLKLKEVENALDRLKNNHPDRAETIADFCAAVGFPVN